MRHFFYSFFLFIITYAVFFFNVYHLKEHEITILLQGQSQQLSSAYKAVTSMYSISIESYFKFVVLQPNVVEILHKAQKASLEEKAVLRGELYRSLYPTYHETLSNTGFANFIFIRLQERVFYDFISRKRMPIRYWIFDRRSKKPLKSAVSSPVLKVGASIPVFATFIRSSIKRSI